MYKLFKITSERLEFMSIYNNLIKTFLVETKSKLLQLIKKAYVLLKICI